MEFRVFEARDSEQEIASANFPKIRMFTVTRTEAESLQEDCPGSWQVRSPTNVGDFSAVAYFMGRHLHRALKDPVGLIHSSYGGSLADEWTSSKALQLHPELAHLTTESTTQQPRRMVREMTSPLRANFWKSFQGADPDCK